MNDHPETLGKGRYSVTRVLGNGSFGTVYECRDELQGQCVAVKHLAPGIELDELLLEASVQTRLSENEHVVRIRNVVTDPGERCVVLDLMVGGSVDSRMRDGMCDLVSAVSWIRDALRGLAHAHTLGVLHRDIKPGNLLLDANGRAALSDFGIAEDTLRGHRASAMNYVSHLAPELCLDPEESSVQSDIWAMGCTLYRMVAGVHPFHEHLTTLGIDNRPILDGRIPRPEVYNLQIPNRLSNCVMKALSVNRDDRYPDALSMLEDLSRVGVMYAWFKTVNCSDAKESWTCTTKTACFVLSIDHASAGRYVVEMTRDLGSGPRRVSQANFAQEGAARRAARKQLMAVADGSWVLGGK